MNRPRIFLTIAYDGTDFCGWQSQENGRTVQDVLEEALAKVQKERVPVIGSGRTDSGVHARGQVAHFDSLVPSIPPEKFAPALNSLLPRDVRVLESREAAGDMHARYSARIRVYQYFLAPGKGTGIPSEDRYSWTLRHGPDILRLNSMARAVTGIHDFSAFAALKDPSPSRVREIYSCGFFPKGRFLVLKVAGNAFLWHMVRSLAGTMIELEKSGADGSDMKRILESRDHGLAGTTAPARGLFLEKVLYDEFAPY